ncbi:MAG: cytochrome c biogenesis protein CcsA, partial [candidate division Zixibacteria bacterium]|nr:cytochrome c biogenesis protein CcsA [candidate division Zixibacteria bacterium]
MAYLGDYLIYIATITSALAAITYAVAWRGREEYVGLARRFFQFSTVTILAALGTLMYLILAKDYSIAYVFSYSSSDMPLYFKIASLWGGQEGTFLLWLGLSSVMGLVMMRYAGRFERGNMFWLSMFLVSLLIILLKKSPFEMMPVFRADGNGLNPLLMNYWMTIHPPLMFVGFAAATIPFCYALTALVERRYNVWAEEARRWTLFAWSILGIAIVMGGYWAYETLGWGGYWAWDPVENSSLIPWIFLTAQIHTLFVKRQRRGLMRFSLTMVMLSFWAVLYGTFLTRSGVLADFSVHSFIDLGINQYLITGLVFFVVAGTSLLLYRWRDIKPEPSFSTVASRTYLTALGIVVLFIGGILVLLGTSAPLLTRMTENPSAVSLDYYFTTMTPVAVAILFLLALSPLFRWNKGLSSLPMLITGVVVLVLTILGLIVFGVTTQLIYLLLFGAAAASLVINGLVFLRSLKGRRLNPGHLAHLGLTVAFIGAAASSGFATKEMVTLPQNQTVQSLGYDLNFTTIEDTQLGFNCHVTVERGGDEFVGSLAHEFWKNSEGVMRKPHVKNYWLDDLYLSPVAFEEPQTKNPGTLYLEKGGTVTQDGYEVTFHDFETGQGHDAAMASLRAVANLTIRHDGVSEEVGPAIRVEANDFIEEPASFDNDRATVTIVGLRPEEGGVVIRLAGESVTPPPVQAASLVIEISKKPLIQLFWLGTLMVFGAGVIGVTQKLRHANGRRFAETDDLSVEESDDEPSSVPSGNPA